MEEITFLAEENAGAPSCSGVGLHAQLFIVAFDVDAGTTTSLIVQRSIDLPKMIENSSPVKLFSFFLVVSTCGPVELLENCLVGRGRLIGNGSENLS